MRVCDKCHINIYIGGYRIDDMDFCRRCFTDYQKLEHKLDKEKMEKLKAWVKKNDR